MSKPVALMKILRIEPSVVVRPKFFIFMSSPEKMGNVVRPALLNLNHNSYLCHISFFNPSWPVLEQINFRLRETPSLPQEHR